MSGVQESDRRQTGFHSPRIHPETRLGYVHLTVSDLDRSLEFYQRSLGLQIHRCEGDTVHLGAGRGDLLRLSVSPGARRVSGSAGLYHFALLVPSRQELAQSLRRVVETAAPIQGFADHLVSEAIYLVDPDDNGIEIYRDRPRSDWQYGPDGRLKMDTLALDAHGLLALAEEGEAQLGLHPDTVLGHMHLHVADLAAAERFYRDVLGFDLVFSDGRSASFLSAGGYHHHIGINTWAGVGAPPQPADALGMRHFGVTLPDQAELDRLMERLAGAAASFDQRDDGLLVRDPSQNRILFSLAR
jgi:catechol 2,3-dioxygenase